MVNELFNILRYSSIPGYSMQGSSIISSWRYDGTVGYKNESKCRNMTIWRNKTVWKISHARSDRVSSRSFVSSHHRSIYRSQFWFKNMKILWDRCLAAVLASLNMGFIGKSEPVTIMRPAGFHSQLIPTRLHRRSCREAFALSSLRLPSSSVQGEAIRIKLFVFSSPATATTYSRHPQNA